MTAPPDTTSSPELIALAAVGDGDDTAGRRRCQERSPPWQLACHEARPCDGIADDPDRLAYTPRDRSDHRAATSTKPSRNVLHRGVCASYVCSAAVRSPAARVGETSCWCAATSSSSVASAAASSRGADPAVLTVANEVHRLPDRCRDQRDAARHRLEHRLRPSLLPRRDGVRVERVVEPADLLGPLDEPVHIGDSAPRQLRANVAARRAREKNVQLRYDRSQVCESRDEDVRPLDQLRLVPLAEPDAVLLERADDERGLRERERPPRCATLLGRPRREPSRLDPDRDPVHLPAIDAGLEDDLLHLAVRNLDPGDLRVVAPEILEADVELGRIGRPRASVVIGGGERGASSAASPRRGARSGCRGTRSDTGSKAEAAHAAR